MNKHMRLSVAGAVLGLSIHRTALLDDALIVHEEFIDPRDIYGDQMIEGADTPCFPQNRAERRADKFKKVKRK
jgi:hypothetical protein